MRKALVYLLALSIPFTTTANGQNPPGGATEVIPRNLELTIVSVSPSRNVLEHQAIQIAYRLLVSLTGVVPNPPPLSAAVCPESNEGTCFVIPDVQPREYHGTIEARAPAAGAEKPVRIQLVSPPPCPSAGRCPVSVLLHMAGLRTLGESDVFPIPVAARYEVAIDSFTVFRARSCKADTVKISLRSALQGDSVGDSLCNVVGGTFCAINVDEGDHPGPAPCWPGGPTYSPGRSKVYNVRVGPFDLTPEVSNNLIFEYDLMNLGESYDETATQTFLDFMSKLAAGVLDATAKDNRSFDTLNSWAQQVHGLGGCDGLLAAGSQLFLNKSSANLPGVPTLESATRATGRYKSDPVRYEGTTSPMGCGENSLYDVSWSVIRTSWRP
jgi:hypothetical protein